MKISTKGQYALIIMLDLGVNDKGEYITIKSIAKRQGLSEKYLEQIMTILTRAGCVKSVRGSKGGYRLSYNPSEYTVGEILRVIEGSLAPVAGLDDKKNTLSEQDCCVTYEVWIKLYKAINHIVDNITLEELVQRHRAKEAAIQS